jgi:hypothetical protein
VTWDRTGKIALAIGVAAWLGAAALTRGELEAARRRDPIRARTAIVLSLYLGAALAVLRGLPRGRPPELPTR